MSSLSNILHPKSFHARVLLRVTAVGTIHAALKNIVNIVRGSARFRNFMNLVNANGLLFLPNISANSHARE